MGGMKAAHRSAAIACGARPVPFRTRKLSRTAPMVLRGQPVGEQGAADRWTALAFFHGARAGGYGPLFSIDSSRGAPAPPFFHFPAAPRPRPRGWRYRVGPAPRRGGGRGRAPPICVRNVETQIVARGPRRLWHYISLPRGRPSEGEAGDPRRVP